jgi:hypothetical protein
MSGEVWNLRPATCHKNGCKKLAVMAIEYPSKVEGMSYIKMCCRKHGDEDNQRAEAA